MEVMELCEPCLVNYVRCVGMPEVWRECVRFVFNKTESKLEVEVLKEVGSVRMIPKNFAQIYSIANGQFE
jgi:hypothetical protein